VLGCVECGRVEEGTWYLRWEDLTRLDNLILPVKYFLVP
jgi:hypothetical protein